MAARKPRAGGVRGTVFREAARERTKDAGTLLQAGRFGGAIYLVGYAVECHLKYCFCLLKEQVYLPQRLETHSWDLLRREAGLTTSFDQQKPMAALFDASAEAWSTSLRYTSANPPADRARELYSEMKQLYEFLKELVP